MKTNCFVGHLTPLSNLKDKLISEFYSDTVEIQISSFTVITEFNVYCRFCKYEIKPAGVNLVFLGLSTAAHSEMACRAQLELAGIAKQVSIHLTAEEFTLAHLKWEYLISRLETKLLVCTRDEV